MATTLRFTPADALRIGAQIRELSIQDKAKLVMRLDAAMLEGMGEDLAILGETVSGAATAKVQKKAATQSQNETAAMVAARTQTIRDVAKRNNLPAPVLKELGVGQKLRGGVVLSVIAGADMVIATYAKYPDALRSAGVLPTDIETLTGLRNALRDVDQGQEAQKVTAKERTAARQAAQMRVERGIAKIISAAELALVDQPERVALYHAALPTTTRKKKDAPPTP